MPKTGGKMRNGYALSHSAHHSVYVLFVFWSILIFGCDRLVVETLDFHGLVGVESGCHVRPAVGYSRVMYHCPETYAPFVYLCYIHTIFISQGLLYPNGYYTQRVVISNGYHINTVIVSKRLLYCKTLW